MSLPFRRTRSAAGTALLALSICGAAAAQTPYQETLLRASDGAAGDRFGGRVATAGRVTAVRQLDWDNRTTEVGKVYVIEGINQTREFQLQGSGAVPADMFGTSVATDGERVVVGAPHSDNLALDGIGTPGKVYVFRREATGWREETILTPANGGADDAFGWSVAVHDDLIAVGAPGTNTAAGVVHIFHFDGTQWTAEAQVAAGGRSWLSSGYAVGLHGNTVVTGQHNAAPFWASQAQVGHAVAARRNAGGGWRQFQIYAPNGTLYGKFGQAVAAGQDRVVIGAPGVTGRNLTGEAFVFDFNGRDSFVLTGTLAASDGAVDDLFGASVAIEEDVLAVGAPWNDGRKGALYVQRFDGTSWNEEQKLVASDAIAMDYLGAHIAMFGGRILGTAVGNDDLGDLSGSVYAFSTPLLRPYGSGLAGSGGIEPTLRASGSLQAGNVVTLEARNFLGGAPTVIFVGARKAATPLFGGTLWLDPQGGVEVSWSLQGTPGLPGAGRLDVPITIPAGIGCVSVYVQQWALDPAAPQLVSMSNGLEIYFTD